MFWLIAALLQVVFGLTQLPWVLDGEVFNAIAMGWCFGLAFQSFLNWTMEPKYLR